MSSMSPSQNQLSHLSDHPIWQETFDAPTRQQLLQDDLLAAKSVTGLLIAIVALSVMIGIIGTLLSIL